MTQRNQGQGYTPVMPLAEGGMGKVELVARFEGSFERLYALKRLHPHLQREPEVRQWFLEEGRIAGMMRHPNIVSVIDVGEDSDGPYLVMDFVDGVSLAEFIIAHSRRELQVPLQFALRVILDAARGLQAAHELAGHDGKPLDVIHRDMTPQNLMVGFDGVTRVTDFGIVRAVGRSHKTNTGVLKGKVAYMSPEQLRFRPPTQQSDIFALGVVYFELLAGARAYRTPAGEIEAWRILEEPAPDVGEYRSDLPPKLVALLFGMMEKDQARRVATAREVADLADELLAENIVEEGRHDFDAYIQELFETDRSERALVVEEALTATRQRMRRRSSTKWRAGAAALFAAMLAGAAYGQWSAPETAAVVAAPARAPEGPAELPVVEEPAEPEEESVEAEAEPADSPMVETPSMASRMAARRPRPRGRAQSTKQQAPMMEPSRSWGLDAGGP